MSSTTTATARSATGMSLDEGQEKAAAFCAPRNVTIVGASDRPGSVSRLVVANLLKTGFDGPIQLIHPRHAEVAGMPCYPDFASLPEPPDHVVVLVPAPQVPGIIAEAGAAGARTALVMAGGFGEGTGSAESVALRSELEDALASSGVALCGPNCMGAFVAKSGLSTMTSMPDVSAAGEVALVGQSGGVVLHLSTTLAQRGIAASHIISTGNEISLTTADYIAHLATDPDVKVIFTYTESIRDMDKFVSACRLARAAGKSIVAFRIGQSEQGRAAALAHTGSLAGSTAMFDAVAGAEGVIRADTLDEAVRLIELLVGSGVPAGPRLGVITLSGAFRGVVSDAVDRVGLTTPVLSKATLATLRDAMLPDTPVGNPLDGGFSVLSSAETLLACVEAMAHDPEVDCVAVQVDWAPELAEEAIGRGIGAVARYAGQDSPKPVVFLSMATQSDTDHTRGLRATFGATSFLQEPNAAFAAISKAVRAQELVRMSQPPAPVAVSSPSLPAGWNSAGGALDEATSKELIAAYGVPVLSEEIASTQDEAVAAAGRVGYPVVMKVVSEAITHKSDVGGVQLDLADEDAVRQAFDRIHQNIGRHGFTADRVLVAPMVTGGIELALGVVNDPELGLGLMVASGGVALEIDPDATFAAPPVGRERALDMLRSTRSWALLEGYRGSAPADVDAVVEAIVALSRLATDLGPQLESIDVNPFIARPVGHTPVALDALVVLRR